MNSLRQTRCVYIINNNAVKSLKEALSLVEEFAAKVPTKYVKTTGVTLFSTNTTDGEDVFNVSVWFRRPETNREILDSLKETLKYKRQRITENRNIIKNQLNEVTKISKQISKIKI